MASNRGQNDPARVDHCHPCFILDGKKKDPSYRCEECQHQLCDECFKHHRRNMATRGHTVVALQLFAASQIQVSGRGAKHEDQIDTKPDKNKDTHSIALPGKVFKPYTFEVSGRRAKYETPRNEVSGRKAKYEVSGRRVTGSDSVDQDQAVTSTCNIKNNELGMGSDSVDQDQAVTSTCNIKNNELGMGSDSVDQDQTVASSMRNMKLDAGTSNTQTTRETGKPYTTVTLKHKLKVNRGNDEHQCWITGLVVLQDKLIVCDLSNYKLKVYDSSYRFLYEYKCDNQPYDIDMLDVITVVVSFDSGLKMGLFSVGNDSMKEISKIDTEHWCEGVCCYEGKIYCVVDWDEVRVYTPGGHLEFNFEHLSDGEVECDYLWNITVNPQTGTLYVTDEDKGVLALSTSGDVIAIMATPQLIWPRPQLIWPRGIAVDHHGYIYVCGFLSNNIIQISPEGQNIVEIMSGEDKCRWPTCVKIYGNKMFVAHDDPESHNIVSIYQLS